ncbi:MAG: hypothetical protein JNK88_12395 [Mangrovicoccus sp.]|nr:hypothetical protein [Mangrovicoccus sp.]
MLVDLKGPGLQGLGGAGPEDQTQGDDEGPAHRSAGEAHDEVASGIALRLPEAVRQDRDLALGDLAEQAGAGPGDVDLDVMGRQAQAGQVPGRDRRLGAARPGQVGERDSPRKRRGGDGLDAPQAIFDGRVEPGMEGEEEVFEGGRGEQGNHVGAPEYPFLR